MKYGIALPLSGIDGNIERLVEYAQIAEESGWDGVFLEEYFTYWRDEGVTYDTWLALTAIALRTQRIMLGTTVTPLPTRLPWKLAREIVTLDHLSRGRVILGLGLGDPQDHSFGKQIDLKTRAAMLDEGLEILVGLMSGEPFSYQGTYYQVSETTFLPRPVQQPRIPIWLGGFWPRKAPARRAARWDGFVPAKVPDENGDGNIKPDDIRAIKDFISQHRTSGAPFNIVAGGFTSGEPAAMRAHVEPFIEAGATWWVEFILPDPDEIEQALERIKQGPPK